MPGYYDELIAQEDVRERAALLKTIRDLESKLEDMLNTPVYLRIAGLNQLVEQYERIMWAQHEEIWRLRHERDERIGIAIPSLPKGGDDAE